MSAAESLDTPHLFDLGPTDEELAAIEGADNDDDVAPEWVPGTAPDDGIYEAVIRVRHKLVQGDELIPGDEWAFRLTAMGLANCTVTVVTYEEAS